MLILCGLASASSHAGETLRNYSNDLRTTDVAKLRATFETIKANAGDIEPLDLLVMAVKMHEVGDKADALFWFYAAQLRIRYIQAIAPEETRGQLFASIFTASANLMHEPVRGEPLKVVAVIDRVLQWDEQTPFDVARFKPQPALTASEIEAKKEKIKGGLRELRTQFASMKLPQQEECKPFDPAVIGQRRAEMWGMRPTADDEVKRFYNTEPIHRRINGREYKLPMHYLSPFGRVSPRQSVDRLDVRLFWPELSGYTRENWRDYVHDENSMSVLLEVPDKGGYESRLSRSAQNAAPPSRKNHDLDVFHYAESGRCFPQELMTGTANDRPVYILCSSRPDYRPYSRCSMIFSDVRRGYGVHATFHLSLLPHWKRLHSGISELIVSWQLAAGGVSGPKESDAAEGAVQFR